MKKTTNHNLPIRILSGVQPTGSLHIGNYFGAIKQHIELQHQFPGEAFYFVADYHALTTVHERSVLRSYTASIAADYIALGLEPKKAVLYRQSDIPELCELMWILTCVTPKGLLDRAHAYKAKIQQGMDPTLGLYLYPVLMAADILAVRASLVPVGEDQKQHLEIARDIVKSFHAKFQANVFPLPDIKLNNASTVIGTDGSKMSKSSSNTIRMFADEGELEAKIASIRTSSASRGSPIDPDGDLVFGLYSLVALPVDVQEMRNRYLKGNIGYREAKAELVKSFLAYFANSRQKRAELDECPEFVEEVLQDGAARARPEVRETLQLIRDTVGITRLGPTLQMD